MKDHVPTGHVAGHLLAAFVQGDLGDATAALVAEHLDACPACSNLVREAEPLSRLFASVDEPEPPAGLVAAILDAEARLDRPAATRAPWAEVAVAAALVSAAGGLAWTEVAPSTWWGRLTGSAHALSSLGAHVLAAPGAIAFLGVVALLSGLGSWRLARPDRSVGG